MSLLLTSTHPLRGKTAPEEAFFSLSSTHDGPSGPVDLSEQQILLVNPIKSRTISTLTSFGLWTNDTDPEFFWGNKHVNVLKSAFKSHKLGRNLEPSLFLCSISGSEL